VTQRVVTGSVRMRLYRGCATAVGASSPYSLYDPELATFGQDASFRHEDAAGFIKLLGLPVQVQARLQKRLDQQPKA